MIVNIDGIFLNVTHEISVMEACFLLKKQIPSFCYHSDLLLEGNCRMCLIEIEKMPKLQAACCLPIQNTMSIKTNSPNVLKARENILEFILLQHPLDCPICDQASECDLQDQTFFFGSLKTRYRFTKRSLQIPFYTPLIKLIMTRCINCTRCIRLLRNIFTNMEFGAFNRGVHSEVGTFVTAHSTFPFSGNLVDICPVGALTAKPYAFTFRAWELTSIPSLDLSNSFGMTINIEMYKSEIYRITPRYSPKIKMLWISDEVRSVSLKKKGQLPLFQTYKQKKSVTFNQILKSLKIIFTTFSNSNTLQWDADLDLYSIFLIKLLTTTQLNNVHMKKSLIGGQLLTFASMYLFNSFTQISYLKTYFLVGLHAEHDLRYIQLLLLKEQQKKAVTIYNYGFQTDKTHIQVGVLTTRLTCALRGTLLLCRIFHKPVLLMLPSSIFNRMDGAHIFNLLSTLQFFFQKTQMISIIQTLANQVTAATFGLNTKNYNWNLGKVSSTYVLAAPKTFSNIVTITQLTMPLESPVLLQIPRRLAIEQYGQYINTDGIIQHTIPCRILHDADPSTYHILQKLFFQYHNPKQSLQTKFYKMFKHSQRSTSIFQSLHHKYTFTYLYILNSPISQHLK